MIQEQARFTRGTQRKMTKNARSSETIANIIDFNLEKTANEVEPRGGGLFFLMLYG